MTNADKIRSMTDEQLLKFIVDMREGDCCYYCSHNNGTRTCCDGKCTDGLAEWLLQEVDND